MDNNPTMQTGEGEPGLDAAVSEMLAAHGFSAVAVESRKGMKLLEAQAVEDPPVTFWLKKDWTGGHSLAAAVSFGAMRQGSSQDGDHVFAEYVDTRVAKAKAEGAQYLLMVHVVAGRLQRSVALDLNDVGSVYRRQVKRWPTRARNSGAAQLWFHEERHRADAECVDAVRAYAVPLATLAKLQPGAQEMGLDARTVWAEVERRLKQGVFRVRVGDRCGWKCAVSGNEVREALDAAHLPGKNWRLDNKATDGIMLRADLHRLLDSGLAELRNGRFWIREDARCEQYRQFHDHPYCL